MFITTFLLKVQPLVLAFKKEQNDTSSKKTLNVLSSHSHCPFNSALWRTGVHLLVTILKVKESFILQPFFFTKIQPLTFRKENQKIHLKIHFEILIKKYFQCFK